jgi:hypothetical protein
MAELTDPNSLELPRAIEILWVCVVNGITGSREEALLSRRSHGFRKSYPAARLDVIHVLLVSFLSLLEFEFPKVN